MTGSSAPGPDDRMRGDRTPGEPASGDPTPRQRRRANRLGLLLGLGSLVLVVAFFILFATFGFPKSDKEWDRLRRQVPAAPTSASPLPHSSSSPAAPSATSEQAIR